MDTCIAGIFLFTFCLFSPSSEFTCEDDLYKRCDEKSRKGWCQVSEQTLLCFRMEQNICDKHNNRVMLMVCWIEQGKCYQNVENLVETS